MHIFTAVSKNLWPQIQILVAVNVNIYGQP
jgi:hypothetical protein